MYVYSVTSVCVFSYICLCIQLHLFVYSVTSVCAFSYICLCIQLHLFVYSVTSVCVFRYICLCIQINLFVFGFSSLTFVLFAYIVAIYRLSLYYEQTMYPQIKDSPDSSTRMSMFGSSGGNEFC